MTGVPVDNSSGENKVFGFSYDPDCIAIQADDDNLPESERITRNIWIDHCEFYNEDPSVMTDYDRYDGLVDVKNDAQYITMSWNYFHDHHKACLSGKGASDKYERKTTMAYNRFENIKSRIPLFRYGKLHFLNNYVNDCPDGNGINVRVAAEAYVESNYFNNVKKPVFGKIGESGGDGSAQLVDNVFKDCSRLPQVVLNVSHESPDADPLSSSEEFGSNSYEPAYAYATNVYDVSEVPENIIKYSGVGIIDVEAPEGVNKKPVVAIIAPTTGKEFLETDEIELQVSASDVDGSITKVSFYQNDSLLGENTASPYEYSIGVLPKGDYSFYAIATDDSLASTTSSTISISVVEVISEDTTDIVTSDFDHNFTLSGVSSLYFTILGNLSTSKGTVVYNTLTLTQCLKMESATSIAFDTDADGIITLVLNSDFNGDVTINGTDYTAVNGIVTLQLAKGNHTITKGDSANLYYMSFAYDTSTGVAREGFSSKGYELIIAPTPMVTKENAYLIINGKIGKEAEILIYSRAGLLLSHKQFLFTSKQKMLMLADISGLDTGSYVILFVDGTVIAKSRAVFTK